MEDQQEILEEFNKKNEHSSGLQFLDSFLTEEQKREEHRLYFIHHFCVKFNIFANNFLFEQFPPHKASKFNEFFKGIELQKDESINTFAGRLYDSSVDINSKIIIDFYRNFKK